MDGELHSVSDDKKRLYKKRLVKHLRCKKRRLVNISIAKKRNPSISLFVFIFLQYFLFFPYILQKFSLFEKNLRNLKKRRLYKTENLRNKVCIKDWKN